MASGDHQRSSDNKHIFLDMWSNTPTAPSTSASSAAAALTIQSGASDSTSVRLLYDSEIRELESDLGLRTPNGIIVRHLDPSTRGSFRRPKITRRDSWDGEMIRLHTNKGSHGPPKFREHGRNKFAPSSHGGYRH